MSNAIPRMLASLLIGWAIAHVLTVGCWGQETPTAGHSYLGWLHGLKYGSVVYDRGADYELKCDIYVPDGDGPFPTILAIHGGAWRSGTKINLVRHAVQFCNNGFAVVCINYRHAPRYPFPAQIEDCFAAIDFLEQNGGDYRLETDQLLGFGYSAGGHLISLLATTSASDWRGVKSGKKRDADPPRLRAVVSGGAPCDFEWLADDSNFLRYWMNCSMAEDKRAYDRASPIQHVSPSSPPFLLFHGADDELVPIACTERMQAALTKQGVECEVVRLTGRGHLEAFTDITIVEQACAFYRRQLAVRESTSADPIQTGGR